MGFLITLLAPKVGEGAAKLISYVLLPLIILALLWWAASSYVDGKMDEREDEVRTEYREATEQLKRDAAQSATKADDAAAVRLEEHLNHALEEKERLDEAERTGSSPIDVLFGG